MVETTSAAQLYVELLRSKNLGVATFMILEKQENCLLGLKEEVKAPEGVPRLFDLITVQEALVSGMLSNYATKRTRES